MADVVNNRRLLDLLERLVVAQEGILDCAHNSVAMGLRTQTMAQGMTEILGKLAGDTTED